MFSFENSLLAGNIYILIVLTTETITRETRVPLFIVFSIVSAAGLVLFLFIIWRSYVEKNRDPPDQLPPKKNVLKDIVVTLKVAASLLRTRNMLLLLITFAYTGKNKQTDNP